jgi:hypothetical protein
MKIAVALIALVVLAAIVVSVIVERESAYALRTLSADGRARALVLYHPSRDAHFADDLALAVAHGLQSAGFAVDLATLTSSTPAPQGYALVVVVSNTYYWTPDLPTLHFLARAKLNGIALLGVIGGAGSTGHSERVLEQALRRTGGNVIDTRSFWLWKPNDESRLEEPNRDVAMQMATQLGANVGQRVLGAPATPLQRTP